MVMQPWRQKQLGPAEDVRQVWSALSSVLEELGQSGTSGLESLPSETGSQSTGCSGSSAEEEAAMLESFSRLDAVCEVVREYGSSLICSDLESMQFLLTRLRTASLHWQCFSKRLDTLSLALQEAVQQEYRGRIVLK